MPKVSLLLPNLNNRIFLDERLKSILNQTFEDWELIIVDGYSTDGAWEFFQECAVKDNKIKLFQSHIKGVYPNMNKCLELASGEYVCFVTSDDTMELDFLDKMVNVLENNKTCDLAHCKLKIIDENGSPSKTKWDDFFINKGYFGDLMNKHHIRKAPHDGLLHFSGITVYTSLTQLLFRKTLFDKIGLFSNKYGSFGDFEFGMKIGLTSNIYHIPEYLASWRIHDNQATSQEKIFEAKSKGVFIKMAEEAINFVNSNDTSFLKNIETESLFQILKNEKLFYRINKYNKLIKIIRLGLLSLFNKSKMKNNFETIKLYINNNYYPQDEVLNYIRFFFEQNNLDKKKVLIDKY